MSKYIRTAHISLIHPSRSRADKAFSTAMQWINNCGYPVEYILSLDNDDPSLIDYQKYHYQFHGGIYIPTGYRKEWGYYHVPIKNDNRSAIDAINNAAKKITGNYIVVMSDDFVSPKDWGQQIIEATQGKTDWILKTPDGIQKWIITLPIMDRTYYNRFGYIYFPEYSHMFCDTELSCVADLIGRKIEVNIPFVHNHYSTGKMQKDAVSERADKTWSQGEKLFIERYKNNFDLRSEDIKGKITSPEYLNWINQKLNAK